MSSYATKPLCKRIALVFDFDDTIAPDTLSNFVKRYYDLDPHTFWEERVAPMRDDVSWDFVLSGLYGLIKVAEEQGKALTKEMLEEYGRSIELFDEVDTMFERLRAHVRREHDPEIELEFYIISCGVADMIRAHPIAEKFERVFGNEYLFNEDGEAIFLKRIITHTEKTRYLYEIARGGNPDQSKLSLPNTTGVNPSELHIPLEQFIYVGDGKTDIPCFALLSDMTAVTLGVFHEDSPDRWDTRGDMREDFWLENLVPPGYEEDSEMMKSLYLATDLLCSRIKLLEMSKDE